MKKKIYFENLDGLRFLCFLSVFFFHSFYTESESILSNPVYHFIKKSVFDNGNMGVNFFFVLSGFLITYLLIEEKKINGQVSLKNFYARRILRIWPLFYFCVFFGFVLFPWIKISFGQTPAETADPFYYVTFLNNFDLLKKGLPDASVLGALWSIAVEEQFYLVWPLILLFVPVRKLWIPFLLIIAGTLLFRGYYDSYELNENHTFSCIGDMTIGALGAWLISESARFRNSVENLGKFQIVMIYVFFFATYFFRDELFQWNYGLRIIERMIIAILCILIILEQSFSVNSLFKMSRFKTITRLGVITYGLYCLHFIGILITLTLTRKLGINNNMWEILIFETALSLGITILISKLSYAYFETPFLKLKDKFAIITKQ